MTRRGFAAPFILIGILLLLAIGGGFYVSGILRPSASDVRQAVAYPEAQSRIIRNLGQAMYPTFIDNSVCEIDWAAYKATKPQRSDIVLFKRQDVNSTSIEVIKRVVGLPKEQIYFQSGKVYINDEPLKESYLASNLLTELTQYDYLKDGQKFTIEQGHYFLMGDNRKNSSDSREWGTISESDIEGKVINCQP